jgi:hypothetical protein
MTRSPIFHVDSCDLEPREMIRPAPTHINIINLEEGNTAWKSERIPSWPSTRGYIPPYPKMSV